MITITQLRLFLAGLPVLWREFCGQPTQKIMFYTLSIWVAVTVGALYSVSVVMNPGPTGAEVARQQIAFVALSGLIGPWPVLCMTHIMVWGAIYIPPLACMWVLTRSWYKREQLWGRPSPFGR